MTNSHIAQKRLVFSFSYSNSIINLRGELIRELSEKYLVSVITPPIKDNYTRAILIDWGVDIIEIKMRPNKISIFSDINYIFQLRKVIKKLKPYLFFAYTMKPIIYGNFAAWGCGVKKVACQFTGLGFMFREVEYTSFLQNLFRGLMKISLSVNKSTIIFFQNKDDYKELHNNGILSKKCRIRIVNGSGINLDTFCYNKPNITKISFLMIARLVKSKGIKEFYESAKIVKSRYPEVEFHLIGDYDAKGTDSIPTILFRKIVNNRVIKYHGWLTDVRPLIINSSVVVLPSYREGVPRSSLEAMAIGRALITTNAIGCKETILSIPGKANGFMVKPGTIESLVEKMEFFILNPKKIIEYGVNSREFVSERFEINKVNGYIIKELALDTPIF